MVKQLTLSELKAENKADEDLELEPKKEPKKDEYIEIEGDQDDPEDDPKDDDLEDDPEDDPKDDDPGDDDDDDDDDDDSDDDSDDKLEDWQKSEDDVSKDGKKKTGFIPNAGAATLRRKLKAEKAEGREKDTRLAELEATVEQLKVTSTPAPTEEVLPPRPKLEDFDFDEDKHTLALDNWYDKRTDIKINSHTDSLQQNRLKEAQREAATQRTNDAVNGHLERAATLINEGKIKEESWLKGDLKIREALESATPGFGDAIADQFITLLDSNGPGSEKAWYYVGQNPQALAELKDKVSKDPTGASAIMYLASIQQKASQSIRKKRSGAPKPSVKLKGDAHPKSVSKAKKQYAKSSDPQVRLSLKRKAKAAGVDVSDW